MEQILIARETVISQYKRFENVIELFLKFCLGAFAFHQIQSIGHVNELALPFVELLPGFLLTVMLGMAFAFMPYTLSWVLMTVMIVLQFSAHTEVAAILLLFLVLVLLFYARMAVRESVLIMLTLLAFYFKMPYLVPLLAGMYGSFSAIIPVAIGVLMWEYLPLVQDLIASTPTAGLDVTKMPQTLIVVYEALAGSLTIQQPWIFTAFIFSMVIITVRVVSRLSIDYAKEIALGLGCVLNIFGFILAAAVVGEGISVVSAILFTLLSGIIAAGVRFFDAVLDYPRAETVQFEDEHNYYYVKSVPKIILTRRKHRARRARPSPQMEEE